MAKKSNDYSMHRAYELERARLRRRGKKALNVNTYLPIPMPSDTYEGSHNTSIMKLIGEFGQDKEDEIRRLYQDQRELLERDASIRDCLPIFTHGIVRQVLLAQYKEGYLEKKIAKIEKKMPSEPGH